MSQASIVRSLLTVVGLLAVIALPALAQPGTKDVPQDLIFLAEARPILVRVHVRIDGKTLPAAYDEFIAHLFRYLDVNKKGYLEADDVERAPSLAHISNGGLGSIFGGFGMGKQDGNPTIKDFDSVGGKVTQAGLAAYYRKKGLTSFQLHVDAGNENNNMMMMAMGGGGQVEPTVEVVSGVLFALLDAKGNAKLGKSDLAAVPERLLRFDANEDEILTVRELVPPAPPQKAAGVDGMFKGADSWDKIVSNPLGGKSQTLMLLAAPGQAPADLSIQMQRRYGRKENDGKKLSRTEIGLDEATFQALDGNRDGFLDAKEQAAFAQRGPDLEIMVRLGGDQAGVELLKPNARPAPLAGKANVFDGLAMLELGKTRVELRGNDSMAVDQFAGLLRVQMTAFFKQADKNSDGFVDAEEMRNGPFSGIFVGAFKAMDRNGDGKVSEKEFTDHLDFLADLQTRSKRACVSLVLSNESRGLFDLLDANRDGRLSVREMRGAVNLLDKLGLAKKGFLTRDDLPHSYRLMVRRGPAGNSADEYSALVARIYGGSGKSTTYQTPTRGPEWFRKMDKNRDGDVSRKEWLGSDEMFRRIDTDGDGLIGAAEAERFDALHRKK